jgi:hypothetical protein
MKDGGYISAFGASLQIHTLDGYDFERMLLHKEWNNVQIQGKKGKSSIAASKPRLYIHNKNKKHKETV